MKTGILQAIDLLPKHIAQEIINCFDIKTIDEIRLRINKPISLSASGRNIITPISASEEDIEHTFKTAFSYSLHSYSKELANGYITTKGGNRVGICGTAVIPNGNHNAVDTIKYVSSINIRISREVIGCAEKLASFCNLPCGILIIGPPASGKTTLLRDLTRILGADYRVSLIDEQNEISATYRNESSCDIGRLTDVFVGYPKHIGITTAVKVMSPNIIVVDEIGTAEDIKALDYALNSGAKLVTAIHADSLEKALKRRGIKSLIDLGAFDCCAVLEAYSSFKHDYKVIKLD